MVRMQAAAVRLYMELPNGPMRKEVRRSTIFFHTLAEREGEGSAALLADTVGKFRFKFMQWPAATKAQQEHLAAELIELRQSVEQLWQRG